MKKFCKDLREHAIKWGYIILMTLKLGGGGGVVDLY